MPPKKIAPCKPPRQRIGELLKDKVTKKCQMPFELLKNPEKSKRKPPAKRTYKISEDIVEKKQAKNKEVKWRTEKIKEGNMISPENLKVGDVFIEHYEGKKRYYRFLEMYLRRHPGEMPHAQVVCLGLGYNISPPYRIGSKKDKTYLSTREWDENIYEFVEHASQKIKDRLSNVHYVRDRKEGEKIPFHQ